MKKILALLLALTLMLAMAACGSKDTPSEEDPEAQPGITTPEGGEGESGEDESLSPALPEGDASTPPANGDTSTPPANGGTSTPPANGSTSTPPAAGKPSSGATTPPTTGNTTPPATGGSSDKGDLTTLMGKLLGKSAGEMSVITEKISADAFKSNLFIDYIEGAEAVSSTAMMSSVAHSVCILKLPEGTDATKVKAEIEKNMDPRKWVCVEAEKASVMQSGNYIVLAMSTTDIVDTVSSNFKSVFK